MAENVPTPATNRFRWTDPNTVIGLVSLLISVIMSTYFYVGGIKNRELIYYVNPTRTVVIKTGETSKLQVFYGDRELKSDVTAAQIQIWNQGKESVKPDNILNKITIQTSSHVPILDVSISKQTRENVVGLSLDRQHLDNGSLGISWKILEHSDGAVIQLIYAGDPNIPINVSGVVEGQSQIRRGAKRN